MRVTAASLAALLFVFPGALARSEETPAATTPAPVATTPVVCRGTDMVAELKAKSPETHARIMRDSEAIENGNAVLWRIEKAGVAPSFAFGTVHLTDDRITALSAKVREALDQAQAVLLEAADLSASATASALSDASKATIFTNGQSLEKILSPEEYAKVRATLDRTGLPAETGRLFRPWVITMLISASDCERRKIQQGELVLDMKIAADAKARGIPVFGLETIQEQLAAMASVPEDQQVGMLRASLAVIDRSDDLVETLVRLYLDRHIGATWGLQLALAAKAGISEAAYSGFKQILIVDRNRKMRDGSLPYLEKGGAFIAVGALHLPGKTGLIALLREKGYTAIPVE